MSVEDMVNFALAQQGKHYSEAPGLRCGPNSFDCSGLVYQACVHGNIRPPGGVGIGCSTTFTQWPDRNGHGNTEVPGNGPFERGILVYFDNGSGGSQPGHVGISLGDGTMISALGTRYGILVSPLSYGGTPMGGIQLAGDLGGTTATLTSVWGDITGGIGGYILGPTGNKIGSIVGGSNPLSAMGGVFSTFENADKLAIHLSDPNFLKRVGKGALAGLLALTAAFILKEGMTSNEQL